MVSNQGPSTYQPNTLQLGQTGSQRMNVSAFFYLCVSISKAPAKREIVVTEKQQNYGYC